MGRIDVANLRVRGEPSRFGAMAFLVEDALRTAIADEERLVLVRTLPLGNLASQAPPYHRTRQVEAAWRSATGSRVHGAASGAAAANCVWFASPAEARRILLDQLLAGHEPRGWFWRMAVPDWGQELLDAWLVTDLSAALEARDVARVATFVTMLGVARTVAIATAAVKCAPVPRQRLIRTIRKDSEGDSARSNGPGVALAPDDAQAQLRRDVAVCRARLAPRLRDPIERLAARLEWDHPIATLLAEGLLLNASPSLALVRPRLAELVAAYREAVANVASAAPLDPAIEPVSAGDTIAAPAPPTWAAPATDSSAALQPATAPAPSASEPDRSEKQEPPADPAPLPAAAMPEVDVFSAAAGLFLVLPALRRLGFREWLMGHPELLGEDPGRGLLRFVARHYRVAPDDPVFLPLGEEHAPLQDWMRVWRAGLDRWLRRTARLSLACLIAREGRLSFPGEQSIRVRFPLDAIDLRLRRHALDADPGWTDWLGLSIRYRFSEREWG